MQKEPDKPENKDALFCVSVNLGYIEDDKIDKNFKYEEKTVQEWLEVDGLKYLEADEAHMRMRGKRL